MTPRALVRILWLRAKALWPWIAAASSGVLLGLCYPGWNEGSWLSWIALTPLLCALWFSGDAGKFAWLKNAGLGFCAGVVFFCITFSWLTTVTSMMSPQFLGALGWFGLMSYLALYFALWGWFTGCVAFRAKRDTQRLLSSRHNLALGALCGAAWVAQEWLRGWVFSGFGWNDLGVAMHGLVVMIQVTDITGVAGLSFLITMANVIAVVTVRRFMLEAQNGKLRPHFDFTLTVALVLLVFAYGVLKLQVKTPGAIPLRVAAVQGNIPEAEKFDAAYEQMIFDRYTELTETAVRSQPQLVIWPEACTPRGMYADEANYKFVTGMAGKIDTNFLLGTLDFDDQYDYNVAAMIPKGSSTAHDIQLHRKIHLVPFGEYIPLRHTFPLFAKLAGDLVPGDFHPGTDYNVLQTHNPDVKIGTLICFEDTLGDLTRRFTLNHAQLLVNITNDAWFLKSIAAEQHLANAVFRTVENRLPMVRCANTGVTCFIDSRGQVTSALRSPKGSTFFAGFLNGEVQVPPGDAPTFYARYGDWFSYGALLVTFVASVAHFALRRRRA